MKLEKLNQNELPALAEFCAGFPGEKKSKQYWLDSFKFWWQLNPASSSNWVPGSVLRDDFEIKGFLGRIPLRMRVLGKDVMTSNLSTWRVQPEYRRHSLEIWHDATDSFRDEFVLSSTATEMVQKIMARIGYANLRPEVRESIYFYPKGLAKLIGEKKKLPWLVRMGADAVCFFIQQVKGAGTAQNFPGRVERVHSVKDEFDEFWNRTKDQASFTIVRDRKYLEWFVFKNPNRNVSLFAHYGVRGELDGFAIFLSYLDRAEENWDKWMLADAWALNHNPQILAALIQAGLREGKRSGRLLFRIPWQHPAFQKACGLLKIPFKRTYGERFLYKETERPFPPEALERAYFSENLGDRWLVV